MKVFNFGPERFLNFRKSIGILEKSDRKKLAYITAIQIFLGLLDLLGVLAVGLLGTLSVTGVQSRDPSSRVYKVLEMLGIANLSIQAQASIIGISAVFLLVGRTIISIFITRRILYFMARRGAVISANLISRLLAQPLLVIQKWSTQESLFAVTSGVQIIALQIIALSVMLVADVALLFILILGLFAVDPITSLGTVAIFGVVALILYKLMHERANRIGVGVGFGQCDRDCGVGAHQPAGGGLRYGISRNGGLCDLRRAGLHHVVLRHVDALVGVGGLGQGVVEAVKDFGNVAVLNRCPVCGVCAGVCGASAGHDAAVNGAVHRAPDGCAKRVGGARHQLCRACADTSSNFACQGASCADNGLCGFGGGGGGVGADLGLNQVDFCAMRAGHEDRPRMRVEVETRRANGRKGWDGGEGCHLNHAFYGNVELRQVGPGV